MTYRLYEKGVLTCDGCGKEKTILLDKRDHPTVREQEWFNKLMSDGREYDEEKEEHYCRSQAEGNLPKGIDEYVEKKSAEAQEELRELSRKDKETEGE